MNRLTNLTPAEKKFLDDAIAAAERASGKKRNKAQPADRPDTEHVRRVSRSVTPTASVHYVRMSGSRPRLPGHVRARRAADCAVWRFSGTDTPKLPAIHSCE